MAKIHYEADGPITPERFIAALIDFSPDRPRLWPNLSPSQYVVHEVGDTWADVTEGTEVAGLGGVWARERYDWSTPGIVTLTLQESSAFVPGTVIRYVVGPGPDGGCHVAVDFHRRASDLRGRVVGLGVQLGGARRFASDLRETLARLAAMPQPEPGPEIMAAAEPASAPIDDADPPLSAGW